MPTFTITAVSPEVTEKKLDHGLFKNYRMHVRDEQGALHQSVEWFRKASSPAPQQGQTIEGEIEQGQYGPKFKAAQKAFGGGGGRRDPQESAHIRRQHAQTTAIRWLEFQAGSVLVDEQVAPSLADLKEIIDWFYADSGSARP